MNIKNIILKTEKPTLYEKGTAVMWTDKYISKQLLQVHLNEDLDLASRKMSTIKKTAEWILEKAPNKSLNILDLGCGPGLYAEILVQKGHKVTGVDFSESSIEYARESAIKKGLHVNYIQANYLGLELKENSFDLIILIFTDLGVLLPEDRIKIVRLACKLLKPGGTFIFDVLNDKSIEQKIAPKSWEVAEQGFWRPEPYLALSESFLYENEKVILYQHILLDERENTDVYRFWTHFFSHSDLEKLLVTNGFTKFNFHENVLPEGDLWNGDNVTFIVAEKV
jgi:2-polyprenyl-3-methyl-5-hydroxy-6-metoxy-1,4-benzoquinol methylase